MNLSPKLLKHICFGISITAVSALVILYGINPKILSTNLLQHTLDENTQPVSNLSITAQTSSGGIALSWNQVPSADQYKVERSENGQAPITIKILQANEYFDTTLQEYANYHYRITAMANEQVAIRSSITDISYQPKTFFETRNNVPKDKFGLISATALSPKILQIHFSQSLAIQSSSLIDNEIITVAGINIEKIYLDPTDISRKTLIVFVGKLTSGMHEIKAINTLLDINGQRIMPEYQAISISS
ncbi:MAG: fibronectin type III domain-containing protein [Patescibacteria group bacterium]|nr:fibronectin type III domain-containing protein [Patescibacteria group bacterium]